MAGTEILGLASPVGQLLYLDCERELLLVAGTEVGGLASTLGKQGVNAVETDLSPQAHHNQHPATANHNTRDLTFCNLIFC